jgi:hypothetical protein
MGISEALYFGVQGLVPFLSDGEINHWRECLPRKEGVHFLASEDPPRVGVLPHSEWTRVAGAVVSS